MFAADARDKTPMCFAAFRDGNVHKLHDLIGIERAKWIIWSDTVLDGAGNERD